MPPFRIGTIAVMSLSCEDARDAYLDGKITPEVERHLAGCEACAFLDVLAAGLGERASEPGFEDTAASGPRADTRDEPPATGLPTVLRGRYQVRELIGTGGLGRVMRAHDAVLGRTIAIKEQHGADEAARRRFVREAMITARLQHPSIVPVYDAARWSDREPFYAMKLVAGRPLSAAIAAAPSMDARLALVPNVLAVADAIAYAHAEGIIHRDLKPANVMVGEFGETVVIDWGLAKDLSTDDRDAPDAGPFRAPAPGDDRTAAGTVLGTIAYMAPEQAAREDVDRAADVYAIGAMLYHVVSGRAPHDGGSRDDALDRVIKGDVVPLAERQPGVPADLAAIVGKAMAHAKADRYPSARAIADDLRRFVSGQLVAVHRYSVRELARRWMRRHKVALAVAAAALAVLVGYGAWSVHRIIDESSRADAERDRAVASAHDAESQRDRVFGLILAEAKATLDKDPAETLRLLATLPPGAPGWDEARVLAADAWSRPRVVASARLRENGRPPIEASKQLVDQAHGRYVAWSWGHLWIVELATGAVREIDAPRAIWPDTMTACDDGARILGLSSGTKGVGAVVLDVARGTYEEHTLDPDAALALAAGCSADLASDVDGGRLRVWDANDGAPRVIAEHVGEAVLTRDHAHALARGDDGAIAWWDLAAGTSMRVDAPASAGPIAWSTDGRTIVFGGDAGASALRIGGAPVLIAARATDAAVAPDGSWVAVASDHGVELRRGPLLDHTEVLSTDATQRLDLSADGRWLVASGAHPRAWNVAAGAWPAALGDRAVIAALAAGPDRVVTRTDDGGVQVWTVGAPALLLPAPVHPVASRDARWIVDEDEHGLRRVDAKNGAIETAPWPIAKPLSPNLLLDEAAVSPGGDVVVVIGADVWAWRKAGGWARLGAAPETGAMAWPRVGWTPAGAPYAWADHEIVVWDPGERRIAPFDAPAMRELLAVRDDLRVAVARDTVAGTLVLVDVATRTERPMPGAADTWAAHAFSADGRAVATTSADGDYLVWDVATARAQRIARGDAGPGPIVLAPDGRRAALATPAALVLADVAAGTQATIPTGSMIDGPVFDAGGARLITGGKAGAILWDVGSRVGRTLLADSGYLVAIGPGVAIAADAHGVYTFADDLPAEPCALLARLGAPCPAR